MRPFMIALLLSAATRPALGAVTVIVTSSPIATVHVDVTIQAQANAQASVAVAQTEGVDRLACTGDGASVVRAVAAHAEASGPLTGRATAQAQAQAQVTGTAQCQANSSHDGTGFGSGSLFTTASQHGTATSALSGTVAGVGDASHDVAIATATEAQLAAAGFTLDATACAVAQNGAALDLAHAVAAVKLAESRSAFE